jgi:hypothetical protein
LFRSLIIESGILYDPSSSQEDPDSPFLKRLRILPGLINRSGKKVASGIVGCRTYREAIVYQFFDRFPYKAVVGVTEVFSQVSRLDSAISSGVI